MQKTKIQKTSLERKHVKRYAQIFSAFTALADAVKEDITSRKSKPNLAVEALLEEYKDEIDSDWILAVELLQSEANAAVSLSLANSETLRKKWLRKNIE